MRGLKAPFPYYGGKSSLAEDVWDAFGMLDRYIEPFCGSAAVLLRCPRPARSELICDLSPFLSNFWRAVKEDPDGVAWHADYPSVHHDLHARQIWLADWAERHGDRLFEDAEFFDAKAAGWWAWGASLWIGGGYGERIGGQRPFVRGGDPGGLGCNAQGAVRDKRPLVRDGSPGGWGCNAQTFHDKVPNVGPSPGGKGASQQRLDVQGAEPLDGSRLRPWMRALAERLRRVIVLRRDWTSAVTDTMTMRSERSMKVGVFLDPPYDTECRSRDLYGSDLDGTSAGVAAQCYEWAEKAARERPEMRIAHCCRKGDFPLPEGWREVSRKFSGVRRKDRREAHRDCLMLSPGCLTPGEQETLL